MRKSLWLIPAVLLMSIGVPAVRADKIISVLVEGEASACHDNFPDPPECGVPFPFNGSFMFDKTTNSEVGTWSVFWTLGETYSGDASTVSVSGSNLAHDEIHLGNDFWFKDLQLIPENLDCPIVHGFCATLSGSLIPEKTPEPSSIILLGAGLLGLVPFRRKLFGR
jgi:hypothetical protein